MGTLQAIWFVSTLLALAILPQTVHIFVIFHQARELRRWKIKYFNQSIRTKDRGKPSHEFVWLIGLEGRLAAKKSLHLWRKSDQLWLIAIVILRPIGVKGVNIYGRLTNNQRISGPVNAHLTPGPGIYFNALMYIAPGQWQTTSLKHDLNTFYMILYKYIAPGQGQTTPWGQTFDVNRHSL